MCSSGSVCLTRGSLIVPGASSNTKGVEMLFAIAPGFGEGCIGLKVMGSSGSAFILGGELSSESRTTIRPLELELGWLV